MTSERIVKNSITINASTSTIWDLLTNPEQTKKYLFGCAALSDWQVGSPLRWQGVWQGNAMVFVKGTIAQIEPGHFLAYTTFDPNSTLPDVPENYVTVTYSLTEADGQTVLSVTQGDFATVADGERRYTESWNNGEGWNPILAEIKKLAEGSNPE